MINNILPSTVWDTSQTETKVAKLLISYFSELANNIMYCMPYVKGMYNFAYMNHWLSFMSDWTCTTVLLSGLFSKVIHHHRRAPSSERNRYSHHNRHLSHNQLVVDIMIL